MEIIFAIIVVFSIALYSIAGSAKKKTKNKNFRSKTAAEHRTTRRPNPESLRRPQKLRQRSQTTHAPPPPIPASRELKGKAWVIDGDTIVVQKIKVRLAGIDAPELDQPWGQKSKWAMVTLCKGKTIRVELTGETSYDRLVGTCYLLDGTDLGAELIKQGLALDGGRFSQGKYRHLEPDGIRNKLKFYGHWR